MAEVVQIEKSPEHADVLKNAQPGDMIQFIRGLYSHWAIYVGKWIHMCLQLIILFV
jgi:uncharacterized protein YfaT (DUF1175 family)